MKFKSSMEPLLQVLSLSLSLSICVPGNFFFDTLCWSHSFVALVDVILLVLHLWNLLLLVVMLVSLLLLF